MKRENGKVLGLEVTKVLSVFDANKRFAPTFDTNVTTVLEADTIIITIGQMSKMDLFKDTAVKIDERGRVEWNQATQMSSAKNIFVAGEVVTGPGFRDCRRRERPQGRSWPCISISRARPSKANCRSRKRKRSVRCRRRSLRRSRKRRARRSSILLPRSGSRPWTASRLGYTEKEALEEAGRCRGCGGGAVVDQKKCMACLTCMRVCPYGAPVVEAYSTIRPEYCQACGLCAPECPAQAISMVSYDVREIRNAFPKLVGKVDSKRQEPVIVALLCNHQAKVDRAAEQREGVPGPLHQQDRHARSAQGV